MGVPLLSVVEAVVEKVTNPKREKTGDESNNEKEMHSHSTKQNE